MNEFVMAWWPVFSSIATVVLALIIYWVNTRIDTKVNASAAVITTKIEGLTDRLTKVEGRCDTAVGKDEIAQMTRELLTLAGDVKAMSSKLEGVHDGMKATQASVQRVNDYLLSEKAA